MKVKKAENLGLKFWVTLTNKNDKNESALCPASQKHNQPLMTLLNTVVGLTDC